MEEKREDASADLKFEKETSDSQGPESGGTDKGGDEGDGGERRLTVNIVESGSFFSDMIKKATAEANKEGVTSLDEVRPAVEEKAKAKAEDADAAQVGLQVGTQIKQVLETAETETGGAASRVVAAETQKLQAALSACSETPQACPFTQDLQLVVDFVDRAGFDPAKLKATWEASLKRLGEEGVRKAQKQFGLDSKQVRVRVPGTGTGYGYGYGYE